MSIQKVTELTSPPIAGKFYLVPCIQVPLVIRDLVGNFSSGDWIPIIEPIHNDKEIGFPTEHFHYDLRFCKKRISPLYIVGVDNFYFPTKDTAIVYKRRKCQYSSPRKFREEGRVITKILESTYESKELRDWICPHKQTLLTSQPIDPVDFSVTCPSHGLRWCTRSGHLIKYKN